MPEATVTEAVLADLRWKNGAAAALTRQIDQVGATENILRLAREELVANGRTSRYSALMSAARQELQQVFQ